MYFASVLLLALLLPAGSVWAEHSYFHSAAPLLMLIGKWFVFWPVGVRLFIAGLRQLIQPRFTAEVIFDIKGDAVLPVVREIGMANLSMATIGLISLAEPGFLLPAAITGGLYYGLAGFGHVFRGHRNTHENIALVSDLFIFLMIAAFVVDTLSAHSAAITAAL